MFFISFCSSSSAPFILFLDSTLAALSCTLGVEHPNSHINSQLVSIQYVHPLLGGRLSSFLTLTVVLCPANEPCTSTFFNLPWSFIPINFHTQCHEIIEYIMKLMISQTFCNNSLWKLVFHCRTIGDPVSNAYTHDSNFLDFLTISIYCVCLLPFGRKHIVSFPVRTIKNVVTTKETRDLSTRSISGEAARLWCMQASICLNISCSSKYIQVVCFRLLNL